MGNLLDEQEEVLFFVGKGSTPTALSNAPTPTCYLGKRGSSINTRQFCVYNNVGLAYRWMHHIDNEHEE
jgi:hypothetical protein